MDSALFHGHWWLPGDEDGDRQPGVLTIEPDGEAYLELIGGFDLSIQTPTEGGYSIGLDEKPMSLILGEAEGKPISLLECFTLTSRGAWFVGRPNYHRIHVQRALVGAHIQGPDAQAFRACYVRFENLTMWAALPSVGRTTDWKNGVTTATLTRGDNVDAEIEGWTYSLRNSTRGFSFEQTRERNEVAGDTTTILKLTPPHPSSASDFDGPILEIMDLLTLASGDACGLIGATLEPVEVELIERDGQEPIEHRIEVDSYGRRIHTANPSAAATRHDQFRFTCGDRGFADILQAWLPLRRRAADAANVLFGLKYSNPGFAETRLLLSAISAEALHSNLYGNVTDLEADEFTERRETLLAALDSDEERAWLKRKLRNDPSLRERLRALAAIPDETAVTAVIPNLESWVGELVRARNGLAHSAGRGLGTELFDLEWATSGLITLVLMAELGLSVDVQRRAAEGPLSRQ